MKLRNKAAMFGLDSRIALVVFGALSVISGASLYSAINESKITSVVTELNELNKAVEAYMLDTRRDLDYQGGSNYSIDEQNTLSSSSLKSWKGPYFTEFHKDYGTLQIETFTDDNNPAISAAVVCEAGKACYYWAQVAGIELDLADKINEKIDNGSRSTGDVRVWYSGASATTGLLGVKGPQTLKRY